MEWLSKDVFVLKERSSELVHELRALDYKDNDNYIQ